jgi:hypothetical protein
MPGFAPIERRKARPTRSSANFGTSFSRPRYDTLERRDAGIMEQFMLYKTAEFGP